MSLYFPLFRGKQYELIAVREFAEAANGPVRLHPVIEPVRDPAQNSSLARAVAALEQNGFDYTIVINPGKGELAGKSGTPAVLIRHLEELGATVDHLCFGLLFHAGGADSPLQAIQDSTLADARLNLLYDQPPAGPRDVGALSLQPIHLHLVEDKGAVRALRVFPDATYVKVSRAFKRLEKNRDYLGLPPSVFGTDHLYYAEDGYAGVADYLTIGDDYADGGGLPLALVIHLTYQDADDQLIYIRQFCSHSNDDTSDPGGKFLEAVADLVAFADERELSNPALEAFRSYHREERFPGLGTVKKLSMLNHMYVMDEALAV